jgi:hypothetical protein
MLAPNVTGARGEYVFGRTEEGLRYRKNHHQEEPRGPAGPETNLIRKGMAWHWRGFSVGLYVLLLENQLTAALLLLWQDTHMASENPGCRPASRSSV